MAVGSGDAAQGSAQYEPLAERGNHGSASERDIPCLSVARRLEAKLERYAAKAKGHLHDKDWQV